jgi:hypothetical protein
MKAMTRVKLAVKFMLLSVVAAVGLMADASDGVYGPWPPVDKPPIDNEQPIIIILDRSVQVAAASVLTSVPGGR